MMLMKVTLPAIPIHVSIVMEVLPWIYKEIDKIRRAFIWIGSNVMNDCQCKVAWVHVALPQELGGLRILDLTKLGYTLRLRWSWLARTDPVRILSALPAREERLVHAMFDASTTVQVGNG
jgi:hypothetical protein